MEITIAWPKICILKVALTVRGKNWHFPCIRKIQNVWEITNSNKNQISWDKNYTGNRFSGIKPNVHVITTVIGWNHLLKMDESGRPIGTTYEDKVIPPLTKSGQCTFCQNWKFSMPNFWKKGSLKNFMWWKTVDKSLMTIPFLPLVNIFKIQNYQSNSKYVLSIFRIFLKFSHWAVLFWIDRTFPEI